MRSVLQSSPPPPPPANDNEADDQDLRQFTLNAPGIDTTTRVLPVAPQYLASTVTARASLINLYSGVDRFRKVDQHIASMRLVQPVVAKSPSTKSVHPIFCRATAGYLDTTWVVLPPCVEPFSLTFDVGLSSEAEDAQREIGDFVRSCPIVRQEKRLARQRSAVARENRLVLRLQQVQRQMKEYIQATTTSNPPELGGGSVVTSTSTLLEGDNDKLDTKKVDATERKTAEISQTAYCKLQKEIKTQSTVIAAFRKENERLKQQLKQVRQDDHYDVRDAIEKLRLEIEMLRDKVSKPATLGGGSDMTSKAQYHVAMKARSETETCALASQKELVGAQLSHPQNLNEVILELDRVEKAEIELECCYKGVNLTQVAQHAREPRGELEICKKDHAHALSALQKSLIWILENQRLLDDYDEELRRLRCQAATHSFACQIGTSSKKQRVNAEVCESISDRPHLHSPKDIRRIQQVEGRLAELEDAMRWRHPDSFSDLGLAFRRPDHESQTLVLQRDYDVNFSAQSCDLEQAHEESKVS